ncbi:unnamed protein product [Absidia cylindrospora]
MYNPDYFRYCISHYEVNHVERITEKIFAMGGYYPQLSYQVDTDDTGSVMTKAIAPNTTNLATQPYQRWNAALYTLATSVFPDNDIDYLRQLIVRYDHSVIEQVTTTILADSRVPERLDYGRLYRHDLFRSDMYKSQALDQLATDYPQIWKSSICAVLAENNWDYINSYDQLSEMGSGGFWRSIRNFFTHWSSLTKTGSSSSSSSSSSSYMASSSAWSLTTILDSASQQMQHVDTTFIKELGQLRKRKLDQQSVLDETLAHEINNQEYENDEQYITCGCCFGDYSFEKLVFCSLGSHSFCHDCITRFMMEGLFGQGALRGVERIPCIASDNIILCEGCLPVRVLQQHILSPDLWKAYEASLFEVNMAKQAWALVQCASCSYCELDDSIRPIQHVVDKSMALISLARWVMWDLKNDLQIAYNRLVSKRRGYAFQCRNPSCGKLTCLQCMHVIRGLHNCYENEKDGLRLYIEKAMADAVKRTCPQCNLSFQKSDGCNKIKCKCGYAMCYICRKDIGKESYAHFCDHFRTIPGSPCEKCNKCDLYKTDPEDEAIQKASNVARREYLEAHPDVITQLPDVVVGPKSTLDKIDEWRHESILWLLQNTMDLIV